MIREAKQTDLQEILQLYLYLHETSVPKESKQLESAWNQIITDENHHLIICEVDGQIVSSCVCVIIPNLTRNVRPYAFIENVVTHNDYRGKGYASACLEYARQIAEENHCYKMMLLTGSREEKTLNFYKNAGYNSADKMAFIQWLDGQSGIDYEYRKATIEDIEELVRTRIIVLRAANKLSYEEDMRQVEAASYEYYRKALQSGEHIAYLIYDCGKFIGAGGVSFYKVMPTYHNPSGRKAYIMNMYTSPEYRRQGIAYRTLDLLVEAAKAQGVSQIALEATDMGRPLYEKYGFVSMQNEMELL